MKSRLVRIKARKHTRLLVGFLLGILVMIGIEIGLGAVVSTFTTQTWVQNVNDAEIPGLIKRVELTWSSDVSADGFSGVADHKFVGWIVGVSFVPDGDVTALYDVTFEDEDGFDLLQGQGADLSLTESPKGYRSSAMPVSGPCTLTVDNTTGTGVVIIFVE